MVIVEGVRIEVEDGFADERGAIFRDKMLSLKEKNQLMRFFKLV